MVVDQTHGDAAIEGALADEASFQRMAEAAAAENPGAHRRQASPETLAGDKRGYLAEAAQRLGFHLLTAHLSPWLLFERAPHVYTVSSQFGFEALLAGCKVTCFGVPFYAGWGLTDDRVPCPAAAQGRT